MGVEFRMRGEIALDRTKQRALIVRLGLVATDGWSPEFLKNGRDVHMLELDGPVRAANPIHQRTAMVGFHVGFATLFSLKHGEIVFEDQV